MALSKQSSDVPIVEEPTRSGTGTDADKKTEENRIRGVERIESSIRLIEAGGKLLRVLVDQILWLLVTILGLLHLVSLISPK
ncbi:MAG: hypothetical protein JNM34_12795 [Chthonomonadaceae bacterium]|nr:hypothetical protein [Chthonomonadaceae bacterium]